MENIFYGKASSPYGDVVAVIKNDSPCNTLCELRFMTKDYKSEIEDIEGRYKRATLKEDNVLVKDAVDKVFKGSPVQYELFGTDFQKSVWKELLKIPKGETSTYEKLACALDKPKACRAVGNAVGKNPVHYLVPCHRVIRKDGSLGGFAGGVDVKRSILKAEGVEQV